MKKILTKKKPEKRLLIRLKKRAGRSRSGRITVRHRGGGVKRLYRKVDFGQERIDAAAEVLSLEYDPYRTTRIMLLKYSNGGKAYRLAPEGIKVKDKVITAEEAEIKIGNRIKLKNIPIGTSVFNIELKPNKGGQIVRSAGASALVLAHENKYTHLKMPSKEIRKVLSSCFATIGQTSYATHKYSKLRKAGQTRLKRKRPQVRGTVMPPSAHPHGGGEGKTSIGMPYPKTPWGKPARGVKTRRRKSTDKYIIKRRK
jgi:large subunit ribosomal protein L2